MLDLISLWMNTLSQPENRRRNYRLSKDKPAIANFDSNTIQSSFEFTSSPQVYFVKDIRTLEPADVYDQLPELYLTTEEQEIIQSIVEMQQEKNPKFYNGKQMVVTGVVYNESTNVLYMEAKQVSFGFILAFRDKKFPEWSELYQLKIFKTGVLAPLITRDGKSMLMQNASNKLFSVAAGFLEVYDGEKRLNFNNSNLVIETAINELKEELIGIKGSEKLRFEFSRPQITAVSFRVSTNNPLGTVEFVAPAHADCHSSFLQQVFLTNQAESACEHTTEQKIIPLDSQQREELLLNLLTSTNVRPGATLYLPVVLSLTRMNNASAMMSLPRAIPDNFSIAWPLSFFATKIPRLRASAQEEDLTEDSSLPGLPLFCKT